MQKNDTAKNKTKTTIPEQYHLKQPKSYAKDTKICEETIHSSVNSIKSKVGRWIHYSYNQSL